MPEDNDILKLLREKIKFHIRDTASDDDEINQVITQVIEDIANEVKIFKKIYGFTIDEEMKIYDFNALAMLSSKLELELEAVSIGDIPQELVTAYLAVGGEIPSPDVHKVLYPGTYNIPLELLDIYDEDGYSIVNKFHYAGTSERICYDENWLKDNNGKYKAFTMSVIPNVQELRSEELAVITGCIIEGCKYYFSNTYESTTDGQLTNLYYQRYWQKKQALINQFPTKIFAHIKDKKGQTKWP